MKIYFDGSVYYTRERFLRMVRSNAEYIIDPTTTYYSDKIGYAKETVTIEGQGYMVFKPEQLEDDEIIYLLSHYYGGFIKEKIAEELAKVFGFDSGYTLTKTTEIEVKE
jgi:hypothetical protein